MRFVDEYHDPAIASHLARSIGRLSTKPVQFMEFCGGHTHAILRYGIRDLLPPTVTMRSGPGCPVCVTSARDIDRAIAMSQIPGVILATYGDLVRVPGSITSLERAKATGADVRVVYSSMDAVDLAERNPDRQVILVGIGFETTAPTVAASILQASGRGLTNYRVLSLLKLTPPVMQALLRSGETHIDGIVCPGHVSVVIGTLPYEELPVKYNIGCVVTGFEPLDILRSVQLLVEQAESNTPHVVNAYSRVVETNGNQVALAMMGEVFEPCTANWRGIGSIPSSGLALRPSFRQYDAGTAFPIEVEEAPEPPGCRCGDILRGAAVPAECPLFSRTCTPEHPIGPCMVSNEGACAAHYRYADTA
ncbi:MAG: hydrogenase formation protein HypD [Dehalococcoidia bacterium]|nr:hydrogenase formation protein HypD [Dehalococcoidia bacterium]